MVVVLLPFAPCGDLDAVSTLTTPTRTRYCRHSKYDVIRIQEKSSVLDSSLVPAQPLLLGATNVDSLVDLSGLTRPLTKLVEVTASGVGTLYAPFGTVRQAKADARAKIILAQANSEVASLEVRAENRCKYREAIRQENIEQVVTMAASELPEEVSPDPVDQDWALKFFDHAQDVCDEDMRKIWARILARETSKPGSFSKRTLDFLRNLEKFEAELFTDFLSLVMLNKKGWGYVVLVDPYYEHHHEIFGHINAESHFISIGLLNAEPGGVVPSSLNGGSFSYFGNEYTAHGPTKKDDNFPELPIATRALTAVGQQLLGIAGGAPLDGYIQALSTHMENRYAVSFHLQKTAE